MSSPIKEKFIHRSWIVLTLLSILLIVIIVRIVNIQQVMKDELGQNPRLNTIVEKEIPAIRGNIYANDGNSILATSIPVYQMILDPSVAKDTLFEKNINDFVNKLASIIGEKSAAQYKAEIVNARKAGKKYMLISKRRFNFQEKQILSQLPFFIEGQYKGGGYFSEEDSRYHPYNTLANRTIGSLGKKDRTRGATGIEAEFDNYLRGQEGRGYYERLPGNFYKPLTLDSDISSIPGLDIVSTIDVNFQDIVESTLREQMRTTGAKYGSVTIMEVATGEIKAMANLTKAGSEGSNYYLDNKNYAVVEGTDPGSVFKLASMLAILEKSKIKPDDFAVNCSGEIRHGSGRFSCDKAHGSITVQEVLEKSCNVGIYTLMKKTFGFDKDNSFYTYIDKFKLTSPTGFQLKGEPAPFINSPKSDNFNSYTIPWVSIGYESRITPMQMLTFYNAVANDGFWVQPLLVKEVRSGNNVVKTFSANKITDPIASASSIKIAKKMLEGVVIRGTADNLNYGDCKVAGKTGTAQKMINGEYKKGLYYTSFAGYFPADNPKYSCIVVIDQPRGDNNYSRGVSAPVLKKIADKIFAYDIEMHKTRHLEGARPVMAHNMSAGNTKDQKAIAKRLKIQETPKQEGWARPVYVANDSLVWSNINVENDLKNLIGMTLKDALPILENKNYKVSYSGSGKVTDIAFIGSKSVKVVLR